MEYHSLATTKSETVWQFVFHHFSDFSNRNFEQDNRHTRCVPKPDAPRSFDIFRCLLRASTCHTCWVRSRGDVSASQWSYYPVPRSSAKSLHWCWPVVLEWRCKLDFLDRDPSTSKYNSIKENHDKIKLLELQLCLRWCNQNCWHWQNRWVSPWSDHTATHPDIGFCSNSVSAMPHWWNKDLLRKHTMLPILDSNDHASSDGLPCKTVSKRSAWKLLDSFFKYCFAYQNNVPGGDVHVGWYWFFNPWRCGRSTLWTSLHVLRLLTCHSRVNIFRLAFLSFTIYFLIQRFLILWFIFRFFLHPLSTQLLNNNKKKSKIRLSTVHDLLDNQISSTPPTFSSSP